MPTGGPAVITSFEPCRSFPGKLQLPAPRRGMTAAVPSPTDRYFTDPASYYGSLDAVIGSFSGNVSSSAIVAQLVPAAEIH